MMHTIDEIITNIDFFAIGEVLVDLISNEYVASLADAQHLSRFAGGQVANLAVNITRLGKKSALAACVGQDGFGDFICKELTNAGVLTHHIQRIHTAPTTLVVVSRQTTTPEFIIYRGADSELRPLPELLAQAGHSKCVHTSAFALARDPARSTIMAALQTARATGALISLDPNYHPKVWPDIESYRALVLEAFRWVDIVKPSLEDCTRLLGETRSPRGYLEWFLEAGVQTVALSMGAAGVMLGTASGEVHHIFSKPVHVVDVTGAGDAFWSGLLVAMLEGKPPLLAACIGQVIAERKIGQVGPLKELSDWANITQMAHAMMGNVEIVR